MVQSQSLTVSTPIIRHYPNTHSVYAMWCRPVTMLSWCRSIYYIPRYYCTACHIYCSHWSVCHIPSCYWSVHHIPCSYWSACHIPCCYWSSDSCCWQKQAESWPEDVSWTLVALPYSGEYHVSLTLSLGAQCEHLLTEPLEWQGHLTHPLRHRLECL